MRHQAKNRKFGRVRKVRKALIVSLLLALINKGKIETTDAKAREIRPLMEKMITLALKGDLASQRLIAARLMNAKKETKKLMEKIAPGYKKRNGGYVRIIKLPRRLSDSSKMAIIEFV